MRHTTSTSAAVAGCAAGLAALAGGPATIVPVAAGILPLGFAANLARTHEIVLTARFTPTGISFGRSNRALAVGDVDGDGLDDVAMGFAECAFGDCASAGGVTRAGVVRAFSGATGDLLVEITGAPWTIPAQIDGFGATVALADVTADGRLDFVVGAPLADTGRGRVDVFDATGMFLRSVAGPPGAERFGSTLLRLGDATRDGRDEFLVLDFSEGGRAPTLWSIDGFTGAVLHSRELLSDRVTVMGDRDGDGVAEYACGSPDFAFPQERARSLRGDTGAVVYGYNAAEGFLAWLGDIDGDGFGEFLQFTTVFEFRAPGVYAIEGDAGLPTSPPPLLAMGSADFGGDGGRDAVMLHAGPLGSPTPAENELNFVDARRRALAARFLPSHRALVHGEWLRHEMRSASSGDVVRTAGRNAHDVAIEVYPVDKVGTPTDGGADRMVVAIYAGPWLPGDANADGVVDFADVNLVLARFDHFSDVNRAGDVNGDGAVNMGDLTVVLGSFGERGPTIGH